MENVCVPNQHTLDERDLLLTELQQRMTRAVLESSRYDQCVRSRHELYLALADFFEAQQRQKDRAVEVSLSVTDVRRIWAFCVDIINRYQRQRAPNAMEATNEVDEGVAELHAFLIHSPSIPLEALQQPAPCVQDSQLHRGVATPMPPSQPPCSLFSLVRPALSSLLDVCYAADRKLHRPASLTSSSTSLSVVSFAALCASLVPSLDRVQAVRTTAQLADDACSGHSVKTSERAEKRQGPEFALRTMSLFLSSVWLVWGVLDKEHSTPLRVLADSLVRDAWAGSTSAAATASSPSAASSSFFSLWLQRALRRDGGVVHQQLHATNVAPAGRASSGTGTDVVEAVHAALQSTAIEADSDPRQSASGEVRDFWAQLAS